MKTYLIIVLLILFKLTFAQDNEKIKPGTPINSGFVFIDGKYIEPPYKFSYKKGNVYINGIEASITPEIKKHFQKGKKKYIEPIFKLDKNLGWFEYLSMINPLTGNKYNTDYMNYLFTKYPNTSREQFEKFIRDLPFVQSYENGILTTFNGTVHNLYYFKKKSHDKKLTKKTDKENLEFYEKTLLKGGTIIYFKDNLPSIKRFDTLETICLLEDLYKNTDSINWYYLTDKYIYNQSIPKEYMIDLLQDIKNNQKLKQRFENVKKNFYKFENGVNEKKTNETPLQRDKSSTSFSPKENSVTYFCPYTFDESFSGYNQIINVFQNKLSGYNYSVSYYVDNTDNNCLDFSLDALKNVSSGIVCLDAHGTSDYGGKIILFYSLDIGACESLVQNEADLTIGQILFENEENFYWTVLAGQEWFANNWENRLTQNNSLVFVLACEGAVLLETYGGGAAFAYLNTTNTSQNISDLNTILKKMNGNSNNGSYRTAWDAFVNSSFNNLTIRSNSPLTLCPAPQSKSPDNGDNVGLHGDGWFETDTYCDATVPISESNPNNSPIAFEWYNPGLSITNVHWDDPEGDVLSNKIMYHWESTVNNTVTVKINHNYWQSAPSIYSQYHLLDYDKVTPNSEDGQYSFNISNTIPTQSPVADFSYTVSGNTAYFQDQSMYTPTSWQWNFGDGQSSTSQNVQHSYSNTGTYSVTLTVSNTFGSSSKTKSVTITNTPQNVTIYGNVYDSDNGYSPIYGATVSCSVTSTITDNSGNYSLQVPFYWSGMVTASANGYTSGHCSCTNLISNKNCDFGLFHDDINITSDKGHSSGVGFPVEFEASKHDGNYYYWKVFDKNINPIYNPEPSISYTFFYTFDDTGTFYIQVTVDNLISSLYQMIIKLLDCECTGFNILSTCHVVKTNQSVTFWNVGDVPDDIKNDNCIRSHESCYAPTGRRWITAYGTPYEYPTEIYPWGGTNHSDPWYYTTSFSHGGKYSIKYEIVAERDVYGIFHEECWSATNLYTYTDCEHYGEVIVVDCNAYSTYINMGFPLGWRFFNSISGWDELGRYHEWSGTFDVNQDANDYINTRNIILSACDQVILEDGFIADGTHEFVAETEDFNCHPDKYEQYNNNFQQNDSIQSKWDNNNYINIYPNPFYNEIYVSSSLKTIQSIQLYNVLGMPVLKSKCFSQDCKINTSQLKEGVYVIEIMADSKLYRVKLIKQSKL